MADFLFRFLTVTSARSERDGHGGEPNDDVESREEFENRKYCTRPTTKPLIPQDVGVQLSSVFGLTGNNGRSEIRRVSMIAPIDSLNLFVRNLMSDDRHSKKLPEREAESRGC